MRSIFRLTLLALGAASVEAVCHSLGAQKLALDPCSLLTKADVKAVTEASQRIVDASENDAALTAIAC